jgi:hypothetical protein
MDTVSHVEATTKEILEMLKDGETSRESAVMQCCWCMF